MNTKVVFCYSPRDQSIWESLKTKLEAHLPKDFIEKLYNRSISRQTKAEEIDTNIKTADLILLLISQYFLNSDYCYGSEIHQAIERHMRGETRVIPIIVRPVYWERTPFAKLQPLPEDGIPVGSQIEAGTDFQKIADEVLEIIKALQARSSVSQFEKEPAQMQEQQVQSFKENAFPLCRKCGEGDLIPLSNSGSQGASSKYSAWVCTNPLCLYTIKIHNGDIIINEPTSDESLNSYHTNRIIG